MVPEEEAKGKYDAANAPRNCPGGRGEPCGSVVSGDSQIGLPGYHGHGELFLAALLTAHAGSAVGDCSIASTSTGSFIRKIAQFFRHEPDGIKRGAERCTTTKAEIGEIADRDSVARHPDWAVVRSLTANGLRSRDQQSRISLPDTERWW